MRLAPSGRSLRQQSSGSAACYSVVAARSELLRSIVAKLQTRQAETLDFTSIGATRESSNAAAVAYQDEWVSTTGHPDVSYLSSLSYRDTPDAGSIPYIHGDGSTRLNGAAPARNSSSLAAAALEPEYWEEPADNTAPQPPAAPTAPEPEAPAAAAVMKPAEAKRALLLEQMRLEEQTTAEAGARYRELAEGMVAGGRAGALRPLQRELLKWFIPLRAAIEEEQGRVWANERGAGMGAHGPLLVLLQPEKLAVMVMHETLNLTLQGGNAGVPAAGLCLRLAEAAQAEVNLLKMQRKLGSKAQVALRGSARRHVREVNIRAKRALDMLEVTDWPDALKVQLGAVLVKLLCDTAKVTPEATRGQPEPTPEAAFRHEIRQLRANKKLGMLFLTPAAYKRVQDWNLAGLMQPRYLPMLVKPKPWQRHDRGGYIMLKARIMRTRGCRSQVDALRVAKLDKVYHGLNCLGSVPWRVNDEVYAIAKEAWDRKLTIGELPPQEDLPVPPMPKTKMYKKGSSRKGKGGAEVDNTPPTPEEHARWRENEIARLAHARALQLNLDRHSLRSDLRIKMRIAERFAGRDMYFPYNLDFRGRAYPVPPNLNHMGNDFCRGVLTFARTRPLGARGLYWLKVQAASLFGEDKLSFDERAAYADAHMDAIRRSAEDPLGDGNDWWIRADSPWQCLATCKELIAAIDSGDPKTFESRLPVHQDGTCNGLQHYAALGRDAAGGEQVNLLPGDRPRDVYSGVCKLVAAEVQRAADCELPADATTEEQLAHEYARMLVGIVDRKVKFGWQQVEVLGRGVSEDILKCGTVDLKMIGSQRDDGMRMLVGIVDRKVVKQTVMTSVYGVTFIGARSQIQARLEERLALDTCADAAAVEARAAAIRGCANYLASLTMGALSGLFSEARAIMDWLATLARIVAQQGQPMAWVTPLGLPVVQPYRRGGDFTIKTLLQSVTLSGAGDDAALPVEAARQRSAFPPNFVHSLDSTHMLMTAAAMDARGIPFAAVHDSYWCHAGHVDVMNAALRDTFVELYSRPILEDLHASLTARFPDVKFPRVPPRGALDVGAVRDSAYFFN
ncbi:hypothetical protein JKP88DRAFT_263682 [Tribonema minus]|uniref:DNA-directed RNA polymerase n=1 Tax=Tribonema minus TaxID=303371 RepID=A0A836CEF2_9STRA|nr:hypothetical protein JKP88DRAFT_263682 [Tribonema minus]